MIFAGIETLRVSLARGGGLILRVKYNIGNW